MFYLQELELKFLDFGLPIDIVIIEKPLNPDECCDCACFWILFVQ